MIDTDTLSKNLTENGIKNKETLIVEEDPNAVKKIPEILLPSLSN